MHTSPSEEYSKHTCAHVISYSLPWSAWLDGWNQHLKSFPWNQRCIRPLNSCIAAEWWHQLGWVLRPAWLGTEQTFPISPIHGRPGWPLRRAGPLSLDLRCGCSLWDSPALGLSQKDREPENRYFGETGEVLAKLGFKKQNKKEAALKIKCCNWRAMFRATRTVDKCVFVFWHHSGGRTRSAEAALTRLSCYVWWEWLNKLMFEYFTLWCSLCESFRKYKP